MQTDDLDLDWDSDTVRHKHRRSTRRAEQRRVRNGKGRGGRTFLALFFSLVIVGMFAGGAWYGIDKIRVFLEVPDYTTAGSGSVEIEITDGESLSSIGVTLEKADVVKSAKAFTEASKKDVRSRKVTPGFYQLKQKMRATDALALLLDPASRITNEVTIPEGMITKEIYGMLAKKSGIPEAEFAEAAKDPVALGVPAFWFTRDDGKSAVKGIEGFLFPAKYDLPKNSTAKTILAAMVTKFLNVAEKLDFVKRVQAERGIAPYEVLIAASIAQVEAPLATDMAKVCRVLYNRLYGTVFYPHYLGIDSSVNYWFKVQGKDPKASQDLTRAEMHNLNNPYNTYDVAGWPIGPISNPGEEALRAAMLPDADTSILYWVTIDKKGNTAFSKTITEHDRNCELARKNGAL